MERCSALYAEVQRSVGRLARVCERRKAQLEKHLPSPPPAANKEDDVDDDGVINGNSLSTCRQVRQHIQSSTDAVNAPSKMFIGLFFFQNGHRSLQWVPFISSPRFVWNQLESPLFMLDEGQTRPRSSGWIFMMGNGKTSRWGVNLLVDRHLLYTNYEECRNIFLFSSVLNVSACRFSMCRTTGRNKKRTQTLFEGEEEGRQM